MNSRKLDASLERSLCGITINDGGIGFALDEKKGLHLQVEVRFYGFVRDIVGASAGSALTIEMPTRSTLRELMHALAKNFGEKFSARVLTATGELESNVRVFVGNTQTASLEEPLGNGEESFAEVKVFVLSATAGG